MFCDSVRGQDACYLSGVGAGRGVPTTGANMNEIVHSRHLLFSPQDHLYWWLLSAAGLIPCQMMKDSWPSHPCLTEPFQVPSLPCSFLPLCLCHVHSSSCSFHPCFLCLSHSALKIQLRYELLQHLCPRNPLPFFIPPCIPPRLGAHSPWGT